MANLRMLKKEIDYRLEELVFDCDMAICFQPTKEKEIFEVMQEGVALRNALFVKANNPADAHNPSLVRKHFAALRREIEAAGAELLGVQHGSLVTLQLRLPQTQASAFVQRINDLGQGRVGWPDQLTGGS